MKSIFFAVAVACRLHVSTTTFVAQEQLYVQPVHTFVTEFCTSLTGALGVARILGSEKLGLATFGGWGEGGIFCNVPLCPCYPRFPAGKTMMTVVMIV